MKSKSRKLVNKSGINLNAVDRLRERCEGQRPGFHSHRPMELRTTSGADLYDKWGCLAPEAPMEVARLSKNHEKSKKIAKNRLKRER